MKKTKVLVASTLLSVLAGIVGCGSTSSSTVPSTSSSSSSNISTQSTITSSSSSSSVEVVVKTEELTQEMFAGLKEGYEVEFIKSSIYDGVPGTTVFYDARVNDKNYAFKRYSAVLNDDGSYSKGTFLEDSHYQINPSEDIEWIYNAGLSIGNTVIYTPVMGRDKYTWQEVELTWEEAGYSNVFKNLSIENFTRVDDENKWALDLTEVSDEILFQMQSQFFGETVDSEIEYFHLLTNGDKITGYDLKWKSYLSYESYVSKISYGKFKDFGKDVVDFLTPVEGREKDKDFDEAIEKLKNYNYKVNHSQAGYDYTSERMLSRGHFEAECDSETLNYYYYNQNGEKYMNYAYYNIYEDGQVYLQGATNIKGNYYEDVAYYGQLTDILPSFNISSEMFIKQSESTDDVLVYKLDKSVVISLDNDNATYSSFDSDGYNDRTIYLTITIDKVNNTINFHNETSNQEDSGLIEDVLYSEIGKVETLRTSENTKANADDLTWADIFSNDETAYKALISKLPESVLNTLPTFGGRYAYVNYDQQGIIFVSTYSAEENQYLFENYGAKLDAANFVKGSVESNGATYPTYYTTFTNKNRQYGLTLTLFDYWNAKSQVGQFQIIISVGAAK